VGAVLGLDSWGHFADHEANRLQAANQPCQHHKKKSEGDNDGNVGNRSGKIDENSCDKECNRGTP
jgi:hypothetical protein